MKFSKFLRNVNRGIVLLIVAALCFAGYVAYDYVMLKKEKPAIETLVKEYSAQLPQMMMLPESEQKYQNVSTDAVNKKLEDNNKLLSQYWTPNAPIDNRNRYASQGLSEVKNDFENILRSSIDKDSKTNGMILDCQVIVKKVSNIKKISPGVVQAEADLSLSYEFKGNPLLYSGSSVLSPTDGEPVTDNKTRTFHVNGYPVYTLIKTGSGWKISKLAWSSYSANDVIIQEGSEE